MAIAKAASDKKALDIVTIDMRKVSSVCDWFIIASGASTTHVRAIADDIARKLKEKGEKVWRVEGEREASWVILDYGDCLVHIFLDQTRRFYDLERLWGDAPKRRFKEERKRPRPPRTKKKKRRSLKR